MMMFRPAIFVAAVALLSAAQPARAQTALTIAATGQTAVPPDEATATLTVQAQDASAAKAQAAVNRAMTKALAEAGAVPGVQAATEGYNSYAVTPDNNVPRQFAAQQTLQLTIMAKDGVPPTAFANLLGTLQQQGLLLDALSADVSRPRQRQAQQAAIADALAQIQSQAAAIAASLHERAGVIKSLDVNAGSSPGPRPFMAMAISAAAPAPQSAPDDVQVTASVTAAITLEQAP